MALGDEPLYDATGHPIYFDMKVARSDGVYDGGTGKTTWTFPFSYKPRKVVKLSTGLVAAVTVLSATSAEATGDFSGACVLGRPINADIYLSRVYPRNEQGRPLLDKKLQVKNVTFTQTGSVAYDVTVVREGRSDATFSMREDLDPAYGEAPVRQFRVPVFGSAETSRIIIANSTCRPSTIVGLEYDCEVHPGNR